MKLKSFAAGAVLAAASFSAFAAGTTKDLGTLDSTGFDTSSLPSAKYGVNVAFSDTWTFTIDVPSATSFGAQQTFAASTAAIKDFGGELVGYGLFSPATVTGDQQTLGWAGSLSAGTYTVHIWGTSLLKNTQYTATVSALPVPEPETYGLMLGGLALVGAVARRKAKKAA
jgi:hypothetical protein